MPRPVAWLLLVLAFTGPLLTHAEAAEDLERFLVESGDRCEIEPPDGGVADNPVVVSAWKAGPTVGASQFLPRALDLGWAGPPAALRSPDPMTGRRLRDGPSWLYPAIPRRHAWLQHFLI